MSQLSTTLLRHGATCRTRALWKLRYSVTELRTNSVLACRAVFTGPPCFTLEAAVGHASQLDLELLATGVFGAEVHPDLPIATTWQGLYKQLTSRLQVPERKQALAAAAAEQNKARVAAASMVEDMASCEHAIEAQGLRPVLHVATVGAQLNSMQDISAAMCTAAGVTESGTQLAPNEHCRPADALLLVSGSHPVRQLPFLHQLLPGSVAMLKHASQLKRHGVLPPDIGLWAVANPITEPNAAYTEQKIAAGAEVILTQPPLDWDAFEQWMEDARRRELHTAARLLIGYPLLSSAGNVAFWIALCGAGSNNKCKQLQQQFKAAEEAEKQQQQQQPQQGLGRSGRHPAVVSKSVPFAQQWNAQLLSKLQATPGVAGLHVMPITASSKRMALHMARQGAFDRNAWPLASSTSSSNAELSRSDIISG